MRFATALTVLLGFALAPNSVYGSERPLQRRAKSTSGSLKGSAKNRADKSSSVGTSRFALLSISHWYLRGDFVPHLLSTSLLFHIYRATMAPVRRTSRR